MVDGAQHEPQGPGEVANFDRWERAWRRIRREPVAAFVAVVTALSVAEFQTGGLEWWEVGILLIQVAGGALIRWTVTPVNDPRDNRGRALVPDRKAA